MARSAAAEAARSTTAPRRAHNARARAAPTPRGGTRARRMSGVSGGAGTVALPLPARVLNAPIARAARARGGGVLDALVSGRGWIALLFVLLAGIVFLNVDLLQMNREIAGNAERISALKRENARMLLEEARLGKSARIQEEALKLGLVLPAPGEVRYLTSRPLKDARRAAKSMTAPDSALAATAGQQMAGTVSGGAGATSTTGAGIDPVTGFPVDPATGAPAYDPVTGAPLDPATGAPLDLSAGGAAAGSAAAGSAAGAAAGVDPATGQPAG